ncbi:MAG: tRNA lysidine(34) synthetase TilS [Puniceicoccales bacterium]|jgi:tRNA(Ile)-lysidine synthase|nr:tRNA lysidine(34) synthetase TilS [Puniceicoccales bacterium]
MSGSILASRGDFKMQAHGLIAYAKAQIADCKSFEAADGILEFLNEKNSGEIVCVACSGGGDSVFLVKYILEKFPNLRSRLVILHFNHNLRGQDSDGDEQFVKMLAKDWGMSFYSEKLVDRPTNISEDRLRRLRNEFFERALEKFNSKVLVLGHQKNDIAETLLMRMIRGSDTAGLSSPRAMAIFREKYLKLRPLLNFTKQEMEIYLKNSKIEWRDDETNFQNDFFRNKIRNIILPKIQEIAGHFDVVKSLTSVKQNMEEADNAVSFFAKKYLKGRDLKEKLVISDLKKLPTALLKKIFVEFLVANDLDVRRSYVQTFLTKMCLGKTTIFSVGKRNFIKFDGNSFYVTTGEEDREDDDGWAVEDLEMGQNRLPNGKILDIQNVKISKKFWENLKNIDRGKRCYAVVEKISKISVKRYKPLFKYLPIGHNSEKKLGDILTAKIVPKEDRRLLPVVFFSGKVCWVPHLPVSDYFKIKTKDSEALLLTYV